MGDYSNMARYYDVIMTSGYYDYAKIVDNLVLQDSVEKVLEIGCGTGLIWKSSHDANLPYKSLVSI